MSGLTHNVRVQADELLDHVYEYGTNSEGVIPRINQLCDAAVEQLRAELAACREREARMREALDKIAWGRAPGPLNNKLAQKYEQVAVAALAEGAQR